VLQTQIALRPPPSFADDSRWAEWAGAIDGSAALHGIGEGVPRIDDRAHSSEPVQHSPVFAQEALQAEEQVGPDHRVALIAQHLAAFGGDSSARIESRDDHRHALLTPNLA
jgi:hypothetical protein